MSSLRHSSVCGTGSVRFMAPEVINCGNRGYSYPVGDAVNVCSKFLICKIHFYAFSALTFVGLV